MIFSPYKQGSDNKSISKCSGRPYTSRFSTNVSCTEREGGIKGSSAPNVKRMARLSCLKSMGNSMAGVAVWKEAQSLVKNEINWDSSQCYSQNIC